MLSVRFPTVFLTESFLLLWCMFHRSSKMSIKVFTLNFLITLAERKSITFGTQMFVECEKKSFDKSSSEPVSATRCMSFNYFIHLNREQARNIALQFHCRWGLLGNVRRGLCLCHDHKFISTLRADAFVLRQVMWVLYESFLWLEWLHKPQRAEETAGLHTTCVSEVARLRAISKIGHFVTHTQWRHALRAD